MGSDVIIAQMQANAKSLGSPDQACPCCKHEWKFQQHDCRLRQVLGVVGGFVVSFAIYLKRWRCCTCQKTYTHYPDFLVPYKRYVVSTIVELGELYVTEPELSYRDTVKPEGVALGYAENKDGTINERQMNHSTLWHWVTWLGSGSLMSLGDQAANLLRQKDPGFELHREMMPILPDKYRSAKRRGILEQAAAFLRFGQQFTQFFSRCIFPQLCNSARLVPG